MGTRHPEDNQFTPFLDFRGVALSVETHEELPLR